MLTPKTASCKECNDIMSLILEIDCKVFELSQNMYNNIAYMLNKSVNRDALFSLLNYKRILTYKICNPEYACNFSVNKIASKIKILKYK